MTTEASSDVREGGPEVEAEKGRADRAGLWLGLGAGAFLGSLSARALPLSEPRLATALLGLLGAGIGALSGRWLAVAINPAELNPAPARPFVGTHSPDDDFSGALSLGPTSLPA